jgi:hypothetical protein
MKFLKTKFALRLRRIFSFSIRQQCVGATFILTAALIATQLVTDSLRLDILIILAGLSYIVSAIVLRENLRGWEFLTLLSLPAFYTAAVFLFYFLLPTRWLTRLPIAFLYAIGMYAILLTENIFNVAAQRTIQLLRAAHTVGLLLTLLTVFFLIDTVISLKLPFYQNTLLSILIIFPLSLSALWSMELSPAISVRSWLGSLVITAVIAQLVLTISFWPVRSTLASLFVTGVFYTLVGMTQQYLIGRLFVKTTREFLGVFAVVLLLILFTTRWGSGF